MTSNNSSEKKENMKSQHLTLTVKQFADKIQVSMPTAYAMTEQEGFPVFHAGKKKLIPLAALERWLDMALMIKNRHRCPFINNKATYYGN